MISYNVGDTFNSRGNGDFPRLGKSTVPCGFGMTKSSVSPVLKSATAGMVKPVADGIAGEPVALLCDCGILLM